MVLTLFYDLWYGHSMSFFKEVFMKNKTIGFIVLIAIIGFSVLACSGGGGSSSNVKKQPQSVEYQGTVDGKPYKLTITENTARAYLPQQGDSYVFESEGKKSQGTVVTSVPGTFKLSPSVDEDVTFTVTVTGDEITTIEGVITYSTKDDKEYSHVVYTGGTIIPGTYRYEHWGMKFNAQGGFEFLRWYDIDGTTKWAPETKGTWSTESGGKLKFLNTHATSDGGKNWNSITEFAEEWKYDVDETGTILIMYLSDTVILRKFNGGTIPHGTYRDNLLGMNFINATGQEFIIFNSDEGPSPIPVSKGTWSTNGNILTWKDTHKTDDSGYTYREDPNPPANWRYDLIDTTLTIDVNKNGVDPWVFEKVVFNGGTISTGTYHDNILGMVFKANNEQEFIGNWIDSFGPMSKGTWATNGNVLTWTDTHTTDDGGTTWDGKATVTSATFNYDVKGTTLSIGENSVLRWIFIKQ